MVPPALVLTNKNSGAGRIVCRFAKWLWLALVLLSGCAPPGPRALLDGKKLLEEGKYREAVAELEKATTLLPKTAAAWNYLGLAYQANDEPEQAVKAYRAALSLDHKLSVVRYNLGCLYLEQTNYNAAIDELRSFTLLQPGAIEGWVRLGTAFLRARRLDEAEKGFRAALELRPRHPEALNGLGLIQMQRRHWQEALNHFNLAILQDPPYPPAVFNSAIVAQQYLNNRPLALQRYRQYLALQPHPADWHEVDIMARNLDHELNPPPIVMARTPAPVPAVVTAAPPPAVSRRTNAAPIAVSAPPRPSAAVTPGPGSTLARTNPVVPSALTVTPAPTRPNPSSVPPTNLGLAATRPPAETPRSTSRPPPLPPPTRAAAEPPPPKPADVEVAQVQSEFVVKPAQDLARASAQPVRRSTPIPPAAAAPAPSSPGSPAAVDATAANGSGTNQGKKGFFARLNPFTGKTRGPADVDPAEPAPATANRPAAVTENGLSRPVPRYTYLAPAAPTPGSRTEAEKEFNKALKAQKNGNRAEAITDYQLAVRNDPSFYDAYYNLGLVSLENNDVRLSLWSYEIALALKPDAPDARYNFALALKAGGYWLDAVEELKRILSVDRNEVRAHLSIANLYSQQLHEPQLAREHYERVLDLNPRHPEATRIRYWLASNP